MTIEPLYKRYRVDGEDDAPLEGVLSSELPSVLRRWREPHCRLALWRRRFSSEIEARFARLDLEDVPSLRLMASPADAGRRISQVLERCDALDPVLAALLIHDAAYLVTLFANATASPEVELRLEVVTDDACRKFHTDVTLARLVTTYVGAGTQWVPPGYVEQALAQQEDYQGPVFSMPQFGVGLFAGKELPDNALLHRSPRISGSGCSRLFLCINRPFSARPHLH
ncbi:DUF1826 domain-containing protein [Hyphomicrobium sp. D-2]|uniref:DUF1826 domain-containing protein n=1 Tax=Hyphomicrobium sp. D-2 TaxID=3041621 RepID=UPI002458EF16|nr:DUF1826 domain-containing protein [Hyphomicrobium sp. D-2]MDH4981915.1 DUF1826 domain-containing protein [Hyphomicrobium sp. D-2]